MNSAASSLTRRSERGSSIVVMLLLVLVLSGLALASYRAGHGERQAVDHTETSLRALELAETGVIMGELEVRTQQDASGNGIGTTDGVHAGGSYEVEGRPHDTLLDHWILVSTGQHGLSVRRLEVEVRLVPRMPFLRALFAKDDIVVAGSVQTDAFDSRLGTWASQAVNVDAAGPYAESGGSVGANDDVYLGGSAQTIRGDAQPGPVGTMTVDGKPTIWGSQDPLPQEEVLPDIPREEFVAAWKSNDNAQLSLTPGYDAATMSLKPSGLEKVILKGGTYFFTDVVFTGGQTLVVEGPSRVYVTGNCHLTGGGVVNTAEKAENLIVLPHPYSVPAGFVWTPLGDKLGDPVPQVLIAGGNKSALVVYAPSTDAMLVGTSDIFGAVVARDILVEGNPIFHYDKALGYLEWPGPRDVERVYWLERNQPPR